MFGVSQATSGWSNTYSTAANGYGAPTATGIYIGAIKQPDLSPNAPPPKSLDYYLGRWKLINNELTDFKELPLSVGKNQLQLSNIAAIAGKFYMIWSGVMAKSAKIYEYDPETLELSNFSPEMESAVNCQFSGAQNMLFLALDGGNTVRVYNLDFSPKFALNLDPTAFQIPFFALSSKSIVCASCNGAVQTFDFDGNPTSDVIRFNDNGANPFMTIVNHNHAVIGFTDTYIDTTYVRVFSISSSEFIGPKQPLKGYFSAAFTTAEGVIFSGSNVQSSRSEFRLEDFTTIYVWPNSKPTNTLTIIDPSTMVTCDDQMRIWQYTAPQNETTIPEFNPIDKTTHKPFETRSWTELASLDLSKLVPNITAITGFVSDDQNRLFLIANSTLLQFSYDSQSKQITAGPSLTLEQSVDLQAFFFCGGRLFAIANKMNKTVNYQVDPVTLKFTKLDIEGTIYAIDNKRIGALVQTELPSGDYTKVPPNTLTIYDAATLQQETTFTIGGYAANVTRIGDFLIGLEQDGKIKRYDLKGNKIESVQTSFVNDSFPPNPVQIAPNEFLAGMDDLTLQKSLIQRWQLEPLKLLDSFEIGKMNIGGIQLTPQGTLITGKSMSQAISPTIHVVGSYPNFSQFSYIATDSSEKALSGNSVSVLPNGLVAVASDKLQIFSLPTIQADSWWMNNPVTLVRKFFFG